MVAHATREPKAPIDSSTLFSFFVLASTGVIFYGRMLYTVILLNEYIEDIDIHASRIRLKYLNIFSFIVLFHLSTTLDFSSFPV